VEHIDLARRCEAFLVAPATANVLAKMAAGIADDFLTTFHLAVRCPVFVAPAMNTRMWEHPAILAAVATLEGRGVRIIPPGTGPLASRGEGSGVGRRADPALIASTVMDSLPWGARELEGVAVLVTAGPTREPLDPVRFLSNPSSGRMGFALAEAARDAGARVTLVSGPVELPDPAGIETVRVTTALQMHDAVMARFEAAEVILKAAAVSDFRPAVRARVKPGKEEAPLNLGLERNPDILLELGRRKDGRLLVGFAAETHEAIAHARRKLETKRLDLIVVNSVGGETGFGSADNEATLLFADGRQEDLPRMSKSALARAIVARVATMRSRPS
jgi:phosphopantothenoylcysteine decarboxylase/phosphopantothenate--cysteine ligase